MELKKFQASILKTFLIITFNWYYPVSLSDKDQNYYSSGDISRTLSHAKSFSKHIIIIIIIINNNNKNNNNNSNNNNNNNNSNNNSNNKFA